MLYDGRPFDAIEDRIDQMSCRDGVKSALWMFAWSHQTHVGRGRAIDEALTLAAHPRGLRREHA
jgi:hypothetical protein